MDALLAERPVVTPAPELRPQDRLLWILFLKAYKVVVEQIDRELRESCALSLSEFEILFQLRCAGGPIKSSDLAACANVSRSRVSRHLDKLQCRGFVDRELAAHDRRVTFAALTPAGDQAHQAAIGPFLDALRSHFLEIVPEDEREHLVRILGLLFNQPQQQPAAVDALDSF